MPRGSSLGQLGADPLWTTPYWAIPRLHHLKTNLVTVGITAPPFLAAALIAELWAGFGLAYRLSVLAFFIGQPIAFVALRSSIMNRLYPPGLLP